MIKNRLRLCLELMQGSLGFYALALFAMVMAIIVDLFTPLFLSFVVDDVLQGNPSQIPDFLRGFALSLGDRAWYLENLWVLGLGLILINSFSGLFIYLRGYLSARASENIAKNMRDRLYDSLQRWPYQSHVKAETGDLIQRCSSDVETTRRFLSGQVIEIGRAITIVAISLTILLPIHPLLTLISISLLPFIVGFSVIFFKRVIKLFKAVDECEGQLSAILQEDLTGVRVVRAFGRQRFEMDKYGAKNSVFRGLVIDLLNNNAFFWSTSDFICALQIVLSAGASAYMASQGQLTLGAFLIFSMYAHRLVWPMRQLGRILSDMGRTTVALDRIGEVLHAETENYDEAKSSPNLKGDIVFDNVHFAYQEATPVLDGVSFTVPAGKTVAILGATGSGKSSMMLLLQRLYEITGGSIRIGGVDIREISKKHLRQRIGIVLQEPFLYSRSIRENIGFAMVAPDQEHIEEVAKTAHAHEFIGGFEQGYETSVGERGVTLSGGQKQRVAIARTLLKESDILVFDDSLSAVDTETDAAIRRELTARRQGTTTFLISHRITTLQEADLILVFEKGRLSQSGTHEELISREGLYQRIYSIQGSLESELAAEMEEQDHGLPRAGLH